MSEHKHDQSMYIVEVVTVQVVHWGLGGIGSCGDTLGMIFLRAFKNFKQPRRRLLKGVVN